MPKIELIQGDCLEKMKDIPDGSIDLTVTSPPYDNLRAYNGNNVLWGERAWKVVIQGLFRVIKQGGVVVWVVGDATVRGSETGTSFKQALWAKECGFNLHDTMIYQKSNPIPLTHNRYEQQFEYMFVFSKGKPKTFNPCLEGCKTKGNVQTKRTFWQDNKSEVRRLAHSNKEVKDFKYRYNIWEYAVGSTKGLKHPAPFPEKLAHDHIISWSNEGDTVLDPFMGSGTTGVACKNLNRNFIGIELDPEYFKIAEKRINENQPKSQKQANILDCQLTLM